MGSSVFTLFLLCFILFFFTNAQAVTTKYFDVLNYGAVADAKTDNSEAFLQAWNDACKLNGRARVLIPQGTYKLKSVLFKGPCKGSMTFVIKGTLKALSDDMSDSWINFRYVDHLAVCGGGYLDGEGQLAWPKNDCQKNPNCHILPTTMRFDFVTNSRVHNLHSIDSKNTHFTLFACSNMNITKVRITAPGDSPNTDGIKIGSSNNIKITDSIIGTGDDCIAMLSGNRKIDISGVLCGPGHGISIGSLGKYSGEEDVGEITVKNCTFKDTTDGVRIKTWASSTALKAYDITYDDIIMENVWRPIVIDQEYCPAGRCNKLASSMVQISDVTYKNIRGSIGSEVAETLKCSKSRPCKNIVLQNINLWSSGHDRQIYSSCFNVNGYSYGHQNPPSCI